MKVIFDSYNPNETIPISRYLKNKKLKKYFNLETMAALVCFGKLTDEIKLDPETPFYYATGLMEYEDYGLKEIIENSVDEDGNFSQQLFVSSSRIQISPLNQFKVLQNMPLSFLTINYNLQGENAVVYSSASGLLNYALHSATNGPMIIGAGKTYKDGGVEVGFAHAEKKDIKNSFLLSFTDEAIEIFRLWSKGNCL